MSTPTKLIVTLADEASENARLDVLHIILQNRFVERVDFLRRQHNPLVTDRVQDKQPEAALEQTVAQILRYNRQVHRFLTGVRDALGELNAAGPVIGKLPPEAP